jgi:hypothetical protein
MAGSVERTAWILGPGSSGNGSYMAELSFVRLLEDSVSVIWFCESLKSE